MERGKFITLEGCEGVGKSTQARHICEWLDELGIPYILTREPGGCEIAEEIRKIALNADNETLDGECEALLHTAARVQHIKEVIEPALREGKYVICDRYIDSSLAYQGVARGMGVEYIKNLNSYAINNCMPDITLFLDLSPDEAFKRKNGADSNDRMEAEGLDFHMKVYNGFLDLLERYPRIYAVDCSGSEEDTAKNIRNMLLMSGVVKGKDTETATNETIMNVQDIIVKCVFLGGMFIGHFTAICEQGGMESSYFTQCCEKMQGWWESVSLLVVKETYKLISGDCLVNWFFTHGQDIDTFIDNEDELRIYEKLYSTLIGERQDPNPRKVIDIMTDLLRGEQNEE